MKIDVHIIDFLHCTTKSGQMRYSLFLLLTIWSMVVIGQTTLNMPIGSNMVIQSGTPLVLEGSDSKAQKVSVEFAGQTRQTYCNDNNWYFAIDNLPIGGPYTLSIKGSSSIEIHNLFIGDVYFIIGNELLSLQNSDNNDQSSNNQCFALNHHTKSWHKFDNNTNSGLSSFSKNLANRISQISKSPIGIIEISTKENIQKSISAILNGVKLKAVILDINIDGESYSNSSVVQNLIHNIRTNTNQIDLPFILHSPMKSGIKSELPTKSSLAMQREVLRNVANHPHNYYLNTIDLEEKSFNKTFKKVQERYVDFIEQYINKNQSPPSIYPTKINRTNDGYTILFNAEVSTLLNLSNSGINGFSIPSPGGGHVWALAKIIDNNKIHVSTQHPISGMVRYLWEDNPSKPSLYTAKGVCVPPFQLYAE